jgi:MAF protein
MYKNIFRKDKKNIILASISPQRYKILKSLGVDFEVIAPILPEKFDKNIKRPSLIVQQLAKQKAIEVKQKVLKKIKKLEYHDKESYLKDDKKMPIIISADTIIFCKGEIIGKPKSYRNAKNMLKKLFKTPHYVYSGFCILDSGSNKTFLGYEKTKIFMNKISEKFFDEIIKKHSDKAGCYSIQDNFDLVKSISGNFYNVMGLPKKKIVEILKKVFFDEKSIKLDESIKNEIEKNEFFMKKTIKLAKNGGNNTYPNPLVGAIIIDENDKIIGKGYHKKYGENHAEVEALISVKEKDKNKLKNATMFVNLEPCCHYGKTPPCTDAILSAGIKKLVIGTIDYTKKVNNRGIEILKKNNVEIVVGVLEKEAKILNKKFFGNI